MRSLKGHVLACRQMHRELRVLKTNVLPQVESQFDRVLPGPPGGGVQHPGSPAGPHWP